MSNNLPTRKSIRLKEYDYSNSGYYFVTINTENKENFFGKITNGSMILNETGKIAKKNWNNIPDHFKNIKLEEHIIMPNHIHGILKIEQELKEEFTPEKFGKPTKGSIPTIIRSFKSSVTKENNELISGINRNCKKIKLWQRNYYEKIIRNNRAYLNIKNYIINNL